VAIIPWLISKLARESPIFKHARARARAHTHTQPVRHLNELELVRGEVLANVWHSDKVEDE
jgi:glutamine cyclotransferase